MIDLYFWPTPNGWKASIALEEFGLPYRVHLIDISAVGLLAADFGSVVTAALSETSNGVLLDFSMMGGSGTVQLDGLTLANADATDFIF